ncbi:hypothetical protein LROSL1_2493 [Furfurilactobacillus rossiae]|uniref:zinc ribbon domain-containing protein n=1 Tax=Furfurilactobacillus rossiae TaxID=231049 RepID=UPI0015C149AD|nr:zinc ribbon domain-containing protein [Furfurilactobacillus rossiae]MCF6166271.1 zinc ribbon domain-containing protein [Furfurilactobacillus rossiae]QLE65293.1 hypothetical protein LROSL1_2493 [Furfurilactobacillus rossiae]
MDDKVFCSNCGKQISKTAKFCPYCGAANREYASLANSVEAAPSNNGTDVQQVMMSQGSATQQQATKQTRTPRRHGKLTRGKLVALIVGLIVLIGAGVFGAKQYYGNRYDIYSMPHNYDNGPENYALHFNPKTYIQINDHEVDVFTITISSERPALHFLLASRFPLIKKGSQLQIDYKHGQFLRKLYLPNEFADIQKGNPKNDNDQINLMESLGESDKATKGVTETGQTVNMIFSRNLKRKNFNNRDQIIRYIYSSGDHVRKLNQHKPTFDFDAAASSKNVKKVYTTDSYNQAVDRLYDTNYIN